MQVGNLVSGRLFVCLFVHSLLLWEVAAAARVTTLFVLCVLRRLAGGVGGGGVCLFVVAGICCCSWVGGEGKLFGSFVFASSLAVVMVLFLLRDFL